MVNRMGAYGIAGLALASALTTSACFNKDIAVASAQAQQALSYDISLGEDVGKKAREVFNSIMGQASCKGITTRPSEIRDPNVKSRHSSLVIVVFEYNMSAMRIKYLSDEPKDRMQTTVSFTGNGEKTPGWGNVYFLDEPVDGRLDAVELPDNWFLSSAYGARLLNHLGILAEVPKDSPEYNLMMGRAYSRILDDLIASYKCEPQTITAQTQQIR